MVLPVAAAAGYIIIAGLRISARMIQKYGKTKAIEMAKKAAKAAEKAKAKPKPKAKPRTGEALKTESSQGRKTQRTDLLQRRNKTVSGERPDILNLKKKSYTLPKKSDATKMVSAKKPATTSKTTKVSSNKANASKAITYVPQSSKVKKVAKYTGAALMGGFAAASAKQWINQTPQNRKKKKK